MSLKYNKADLKPFIENGKFSIRLRISIYAVQNYFRIFYTFALLGHIILKCKVHIISRVYVHLIGRVGTELHCMWTFLEEKTLCAIRFTVVQDVHIHRTI